MVAPVVYVVPISKGVTVVKIPAPSADLQQAEYFRRILDSRKAEVCERLEAEFDALARVQRAGCLDASRRHRRAVKTLEAELRTLDRMLVALRVELGLPTLRQNMTCRAAATNQRCSSRSTFGRVV
jgi:hypothetical protein